MRWRACLLLTPCFIASIASASPPELVHGEAFAWGTDVTASLAGERLELVGVVSDFASDFSADFETFEYTLSLSGLVSAGSEQRAADFVVTSFLGGRFEIWRDVNKDHDVGTMPPNSTVPSTFENGELYLGGSIVGFTLYIHTDLGLGVFVAEIVVSEGEALNLVPSQAIYFIEMDAGVALEHPSIAAGYALFADLRIEPKFRVGVEARTWSAVKRLYRR